MKKIILFLLIHLSAVAQPVYCPAEIVCDQNNQLASCEFEQQFPNYWHTITGNHNLAGVYKNTYVSAPFYSYDQGYALCVYTHENTYKTLTLHAKPEANLEMLILNHELWHAEETWWECASKYENACPLQEQAALMVKNKSNDTVYLSNDVKILPGHFMRLYQDDIKRGWVDIYDEYNYVGRILVDVNNRLKIIDVINGSNDYELIEIDGFNAIEIKG